MSPPTQPSFQSMFSAPDPQAKGLRLVVEPEDVNNMFAWLTTADVTRRARETPESLHAPLYLTRAALGKDDWSLATDVTLVTNALYAKMFLAAHTPVPAGRCPLDPSVRSIRWTIR